MLGAGTKQGSPENHESPFRCPQPRGSQRLVLGTPLRTGPPLPHHEPWHGQQDHRSKKSAHVRFCRGSHSLTQRIHQWGFETWALRLELTSYEGTTSHWCVLLPPRPSVPCDSGGHSQGTADSFPGLLGYVGRGQGYAYFLFPRIVHFRILTLPLVLPGIGPKKAEPAG